MMCPHMLKKERQELWRALVDWLLLANVFAKRIEDAREITHQEVVFIQVMRIKGRPANVRAVNNILHGDLDIALLEHEIHQRGAQHLTRALRAAIRFGIPHWRFSDPEQFPPQCLVRDVSTRLIVDSAPRSKYTLYRTYCPLLNR